MFFFSTYAKHHRNCILGSPPHTRDKQAVLDNIFPFCGIIPAYAGQTYVDNNGLYSARDHPRIRGTNLRRFLTSMFEWGSSPHTRDKRCFFKLNNFSIRIIPAYAGQTSNFPKFFCFPQDHPRIRGTNKLINSMVKTVIGSSPHTRDKLVQYAIFAKRIRIIPAYAGQT